MVKIGISLDGKYSAPMPDVVQMLGDRGFSAISPLWQRGISLDDTVNAAIRRGLTLQSLHGPLRGLPEMWDAAPSQIAEDHLAALDCCAAYGFPLLVVHSWTGVDYTFSRDGLYFGHFDRLVEQAINKGVRIAFENLEGEEYLDALMERYKGLDAVGLCWDSGHERCYTPSRDVLAQYGDRLLITHLNDNFGVTDPAGKLRGTDDLHLLIGDGNMNWASVVNRLKEATPQQILNFEFKIRPKGDRCVMDLYSKLPLQEFFQKAYNSTQSIAKYYFSK